MSSKLKTSGCMAAIGCLVFLFVLVPSVRSADKTTWAKFDNSAPAASDLPAMNGRIPLGTSGKGDDSDTWLASVIKDGAFYKMWYSASDGANCRIYYATSPDGLNWAKYNNTAPTNSDTISTDGRIGLGTDGTGDDNAVYQPSVIKDGSTYKMWYTGHDGGTTRIYYATSPDGLNWTKKNNTVPGDSDTNSTDGRIPLGTSGKGDEKLARMPTVVKAGSVYKMWYSGRDVAVGNDRIYHATSLDGLTWTKYDNSIPDPSNTEGTNGCIPLGTSGGDSTHVSSPGVILDDSCYRMWYMGYGGTKYCIYNATSTDGLTWTKVTNAVPANSDTTSTLGRIPYGSAGKGDSATLIGSTVIKDNDTYKMWYVGWINPSYRIYYATSTDSLNWTKVDNTVPVASDLPACNGRIPLGTNTKGDDKHTLYPAVIKDNSTYKMWYSGYKASDNRCRIYYATSLDGMIWVKYNNNAEANSNTTGTDGRIPRGTSGGDSYAVLRSAVIKDGSTYKMWYVGSDGTNQRIFHATSSNGLTWIKYTNAVPAASNTTGTYGRIPLGTSGGDTTHASYPSVIMDGAFYKMWYSGFDGTNWRIYHATSSNGLTWTKYTNAVPAASNTTGTYGRIPLGTGAGKGDTNGAAFPAVIKAGSTYKMWYSGESDGSTWRIYYATSTDGLTWKKYDNSIPDDSDTTSTNGRVPRGITGGDTNIVVAPCVIKDGYTYKMWYAGHDGVNYRIYHATCDTLPEGTIFYSY